MKSRVLSRMLLWGFVAVVVVGFIAWIARNTYWDDVNLPMPMRGEAASNPFYSAQHLSAALGARTEWRKTLGELPPTDAVMFLDHWNWGLIPQRREQLERWVESGGRLVVDETFMADMGFTDWSGVSDEIRRGRAAEKTEEDSVDDAETDVDEWEEEARGQKDADCAHLRVTLPAAQKGEPAYLICKIQKYHVLNSRHEPLWSLAQDDQIKVLRVAIGRGSLTVLNASPFGNRDLIRADHGLLFAAATQLRAGDLIVFLSEEKYASIIELIWNYGAPAVVLAALLLGAALWRNGARFGPPAVIAGSARRSLAEQIVGTGRFTMRVGGGTALHAATVRALHEAAAKRIAGYARMNAADRVTQIARLAHTDAEQLAQTLNYSGARRARELKTAVELLELVRRRLLTDREIVHAG